MIKETNIDKIEYFKWFGSVMEGRIEGDNFVSDKIKYPLSIGAKFESCGLLSKEEIENYLNKKK